MAQDNGVYCRRVHNPDPIMSELAKQAVDKIEQMESSGHRIQPSMVFATAQSMGVPVSYVLDERERRVRARSQSQGIGL